MQQAEMFRMFTDRLEGAGLTYMVTGSVASMVYGEPRLTNDIDIVLELSGTGITDLLAAFPIDDFYCPPDEVLRVESRRKRRGHFNLIHHDTGYKADVYICGNDPLHTWGLARKKRIELDEQSALWLAPPEYVILRKLEYFKEGGSEKHLSDIRGMLEVSGESFDMGAIKEWVNRLALEPEWHKVDPRELNG